MPTFEAMASKAALRQRRQAQAFWRPLPAALAGTGAPAAAPTGHRRRRRWLARASRMDWIRYPPHWAGHDYRRRRLPLVGHRRSLGTGGGACCRRSQHGVRHWRAQAGHRGSGRRGSSHPLSRQPRQEQAFWRPLRRPRQAPALSRRGNRHRASSHSVASSRQPRQAQAFWRPLRRPRQAPALSRRGNRHQASSHSVASSRQPRQAHAFWLPLRRPWQGPALSRQPRPAPAFWRPPRRA